QLAFVVILALTNRRFRDRLGEAERSPLGLPSPPLLRLLSTRFVALLMGYQVLSAAVTYLIEFLLLDRAVACYPDTATLASFLAKYTAGLNVVEVVFLAVFAGALLRRYGLKLGITANPVAVTVLAAATLVFAGITGVAALAVFVLVCAARIADVTLLDGMTRG